MSPYGDDASVHSELNRVGAHRMPRKQATLSRAIAVGGAAFCIGAVAEGTAPTAEALSIVLPGGGLNGNGNTTQLNILEGNVINPQFSFWGGGNVSDNSIIGNIAKGNGNRSSTQALSKFWNSTISLAGTTGNGNVTQVDILSYNVVNPQVGIGGSNLSQNSTTSNVARNNGNHSSTEVSSASGSTTTVGTTGNGNITQIAIGSGNIFNPQWSIGGSNESHNSASGNIATNNGDDSTTTVDSGDDDSGTTTVGTTGNGNTRQTSFLSFNVFNPQRSSFGSNTSDNSTTSNVSSNNGGRSSTSVSGSAGGSGTTTVGTTGNGNATQQARRSGSIFNKQVTSALGLRLAKPASSSPGDTRSAVGADSTAAAGSSSAGSGTASGGARKAATASDGGISKARGQSARSSGPDEGRHAARPRHLKAGQ
jgi:hypothetical protein